MARRGKLVYEHALEHPNRRRFLDLEIRKNGVFQRSGFFGEASEWQLTEAIDDVAAIHDTYKRVLGDLEDDGFEQVYRHEASSEYRRYQHPDSGLELELDVDYDTVVKRERNPGEHKRWELTHFDWDGPANEALEEEFEAAEARGFVVAERRTMLQVLQDRGIAVPEAYEAFLATGQAERRATEGLRGLPGFGDRWLWADLAAGDMPWADASDERYLAISGALRDAPHRSIDPHPVRLAMDRQTGGIALRGDGATIQVFTTFEAFVAALEVQG